MKKVEETLHGPIINFYYDSLMHTDDFISVQ